MRTPSFKLRSKAGGSLAILLMSLAASGLGLVLISQIIKDTKVGEQKIADASLVTTSHDLKLQQIKSSKTFAQIKKEISDSPALSRCFSVVGSTNCSSLAQARVRALNVPGLFSTQEKVGARGSCAGGSNPCVLEQKIKYQYLCGATHCQGVELILETFPLNKKLGLKPQVAKIVLTQNQLDKNEELNFSCSNGGNLITDSNTIESKTECKGVAVTRCNQEVSNLDRPAFTKTFLRPSSASACNIAPVLPSAAGQTGYTELSLFRATPVTLNLPAMAGSPRQYCSGTVYRSVVRGRAVDRSRGRNGGWSGFVAGRPYPCTIETDFHLNLGPGASGGVTNSCPGGYTSRFIRMGGTQFFRCSRSNTSVNCRNTDPDDGRDMDSIIFQCNFQGS